MAWWTGVKRLWWRPGAERRVRGFNVRRVQVRALSGGAALVWLFSWIFHGSGSLSEKLDGLVVF